MSSTSQTNDNNNNSLFEAAENGDKETIEVLLLTGVDVNIQREKVSSSSFSSSCRYCC